MNNKVLKFANITELLILYSIGIEAWLWEIPKELMDNSP